MATRKKNTVNTDQIELGFPEVAPNTIVVNGKTYVAQKEEANEPIVLLRDVSCGTKFIRYAAGSRRVYMKVKPFGHLLNSTLVSDALSAGKVFVVNTESFYVSIWQGNTVIELVL